MSASYSNAKAVLDCSTLLSYIKKTFPTATSATNADAVNVVVTFSAALTAPQQTTLTALIAAYVDPITGVVDTTNVSLYNTTSTALGVSGVFTGVWEDVSRYSSVSVSVLTNQSSVASGLSVQFGNLAAQADISKTFSVVANTPFTTTIPTPGKYMRIVYTNGTTLQTSFSLQTKLSVAQCSAIVDASSTVDDTTLALLTRNLNMGRLDKGTYVSVRADESSVIRTRSSRDTSLSANSGAVPIAQANFLYNINADVVSTTVVSTGTVTYATGCAAVATAALASSSAIVATRRYVSCGVGRAVRIVVSCAFATGTANSTQLCGMGSVDNGVFFGYNGTAFGVLVRNATVDAWTAASAFNVDKLNGTGASGLTIDPTKGNVYVIVIDGTGFGTITFGIASTPTSSTTDIIVAHRIAFGNSSTATGLRIPCGPLMAQAVNTTNTSVLTMRVAGLAAFADGPSSHIVGRQRAIEIAPTISTTSYVPVMSLFDKTTFQSVNNYSSAVLQSISVASDGTKGSVILTIYDSPALTGASYADISANTSACQLDTSATSLTIGAAAALYSTCIHCSGSSMFDLTPFDIRIAPGQWVTIAARCSAAGTSNGLSVIVSQKATQTALTTLITNYIDPSAKEVLVSANASVFNSSNLTLAGAGVFAGTWEDVARYSTVRVSCISDVESATDGLVIQFGVLAEQADITQSYTLSAGSSMVTVNAVSGRFFRVVYTNGASAQTSFALCTRWSTSSEPPVTQASSALTDQSDCVVTRSLICARNEYPTYSSLRADEANRLRVSVPRSFQRSQNVNSSPWIQVSFTYGVNADDCVTSVLGSGTVTSSSGKAVVSSGAAINTAATLSTDRLCICGPGNTVFVVVSAAFGTPVIGNTQLCGAGNAVNGLLWGYDGVTFGIATRSNSVTSHIPQTAFNIDKLDGTGPSGVSLNPLFGNTYAVQYDALGFGQATFMIMAPQNLSNQGFSADDFIAVHRVWFGNTSTSLAILNPQFPCSAISTNTTSTSARAISVAAFCVFIESGIRNALMYSIDGYRSITSTTLVPILTLYNKPTFNGLTNTSTVLIREINIAMAAGTRNLVVFAIRDPTLGALGTLTNISASSVVSYSAAAAGTITANTGTSVFCATAYGSHQRYDVSKMGIYLSPGSYLCFAARLSVNGTANTTVSVVCTPYTCNGGTVSWNERVISALTTSTVGSTAIIESNMLIHVNHMTFHTTCMNAKFDEPMIGRTTLVGLGNYSRGVFIGYKDLEFGMMVRENGCFEYIKLVLTSAPTSNGYISISVGGRTCTIGVMAGATIGQCMMGITYSATIAANRLRATCTCDRIEIYTVEPAAYPEDPPTVDFGTTGMTGTISHEKEGCAATESWIPISDFNSAGASVLINPQMWNVYSLSFNMWSSGGITFSLLHPDSNEYVTMHTWKHSDMTSRFETSIPYATSINVQTTASIEASDSEGVHLCGGSVSSGIPATAGLRSRYSKYFQCKNVVTTAAGTNVIGVLGSPLIQTGAIRNAGIGTVYKATVVVKCSVDVVASLVLSGMQSVPFMCTRVMPWSALDYAETDGSVTVTSGFTYSSSLIIAGEHRAVDMECDQMWIVPGKWLALAVRTADPADAGATIDMCAFSVSFYES
ncbi:hypothetical protein JKP88DRAFT_241061 [Tribonema minus]|uniref:Uncharacterized protein n=1 Tax=Tribonema minus TaxID=303371 RepID=A0A835Z2P7_9STRA|nr:hypothetical protein JKP88DRAFT_241061 [Tribonema minus]